LEIIPFFISFHFNLLDFIFHSFLDSILFSKMEINYLFSATDNFK